MFDQLEIANGARLEWDQASAEVSAATGANERRPRLERASESISEPVFGIGSLSACIELTTLGNAAQADPVEGRRASLLQNRF